MARSDLKRNRGYQEQALSHLDSSATYFLGAMKMYFERFPEKEVTTKLLLDRMFTIKEAMETCFEDM